ncbi:NAD(P)H-dependent oxidoreductase [Bacillus wiedmannii]|uniref:NAD(P)H-dependent oxidoreductase n=1 Tax=Bacillus TaxID=1386 RepID=UPI000BEE5E87|nr:MULTISPECIES: NAD(P)H-dependent oxidoreductase [Bacillus]MCU5501083.1 NAD(P)H-dependent oxidoreductase [Bacillus wiedmannii]MED2013298.1 NAD(P)H-dependent oxidoreductase [Bacillus wiedmannii]MED2884297.1 NAD(P)H-dependent oxidoreductase [Bacillus wiedmannii]PEC61083.1 NAD(P)H-dependent oxidoreductase [Bacillus wiedmannii]PEI37630.1 NAD(P)H-dependent oxidoreductase [Bacillus wiedmannii]
MTNTKEITKEKIMEAFHFRHACKEFDPMYKISEEDFHFILETGRLSPSSFGYEPWKFIVVQNKELREKLQPHSWGAGGQLATASHFVIVLSRNIKDMHYDAEYIKHMMNDIIGLPEDTQQIRYEFFKKFQETDFNLLQSDRAVFDWASKQTYIALGNMMTSAAQIGIDSCPIEGFDKEKVDSLLRQEGIIKDDNLEASVMVAFGYRKEEPKRDKTRQTMDTIVEWIK